MPLAPTTSDLTVHAYVDVKDRHIREWRYQDMRQSVDDQPAVVVNHGEELRWYHQDQLHRSEDRGPAIINKSKGIENYFLGGQLHRKRGPAVITPKLRKWVQYNEMHREDGPASIEYVDGEVRYQWWFKGSIYGGFDDWAMANDIDPEVYTLLKLEFG